MHTAFATIIPTQFLVTHKINVFFDFYQDNVNCNMSP